MVEKYKDQQNVGGTIPPPLTEFAETKAVTDAGGTRNPAWVSGSQNPFTSLISSAGSVVKDIATDFQKNMAPLPTQDSSVNSSAINESAGAFPGYETGAGGRTGWGTSTPTNAAPTVLPEKTDQTTSQTGTPISSAWPDITRTVDPEGRPTYTMPGGTMTVPDAGTPAGEQATREGVIRRGQQDDFNRYRDEELISGNKRQLAEEKRQAAAGAPENQYRNTTFADFQKSFPQSNTMPVKQQMVLFQDIIKRDEAWNKDLRSVELANIQFGPDSVEALKARVKMMEDRRKMDIDERKTDIEQQKANTGQAKAVMDIAHVHAQIAEIQDKIKAGSLTREETFARIEGLQQALSDKKYSAVRDAAKPLMEAAKTNLDPVQSNLLTSKALEQVRVGTAAVDFVEKARQRDPRATLPPVIEINKPYEIISGTYVMWDGQKFINADKIITGQSPIAMPSRKTVK